MTKQNTLTMNEYKVIFMPQHPRAFTGISGFNGYVYEHVLLAEQILKRKLNPDEDVHHLNGNKQDNRKENLLVLLHSQHTKLHNWLRKGAPYTGKDYNSETVEKLQHETCLTCNKTLQNNQITFCSKPCKLSYSEEKGLTRKPSKKDLDLALESSTITEIARKYGVTTKTIQDWKKHYDEIAKPNLFD
jgi:HNH endonuclease